MNLKQYILACGVNSIIGMNGKIDDDLDSVSQRLWFGFGRIQRGPYHQNWSPKGTTMPVVNVKTFTQTLANIKNQLMLLFEASTKFTCAWHKDSFSNPELNKNMSDI